MSESMSSARLATIDAVSGTASARRATLIFDGAESASDKTFKILNNAALAKGDRVVILKISGSYVILGRI